MSPAPSVSVSFSEGVDALRRQEQARKAREDQMRNALEILAHSDGSEFSTTGAQALFVRATAREGLGRE